MAKNTSTSKGAKGKKGKMPLGQRVIIGAALFGLAWYLYTRNQAKKLEEAMKTSPGGPIGGGIALGTPGGYGGEPLDPNTGLPCSQVFGGCPSGGVMPGVPGTTPSFPGSQVSGCMTPSANNYNPLATVSDGNCDYTNTGTSDVYGCMDTEANNYNPLATIQETSATDSTDPCSFDTGEIYGCMESNAENYNPNATVQATSATDSTDPCEFIEYYGCMNSGATNYNAQATINATSYNDSTDPCTYEVGVDGCMDPTAQNYNPAATNDDNSCSWLSPCDVARVCWSDCPNPSSISTLSANCGTVDDCGDATGYPNSQAPPCAPVPGCTDPTANNYNSAATQDDNSCTFDTQVVPGCTDSTASNYNALANTDDGSCTYPQLMVPCQKCQNGSVINSSFIDTCPTAQGWMPAGLGTPNPCAGQTVNGCTNPAANNYNSNATQDDGTCTYPAISCDSCDGGYPTSQTFNLASCPEGTILSGSGNPCAGQTINGCTNPAANNYNSNATQNDGTCTYPAISCDSCDGGYPTSQIFNLASCPEGTILSGSGNPCAGQTVMGCTDPTANNYNSTATQDDGNCTYPNTTCSKCVQGSPIGNQVPAGTPCSSLGAGWQLSSLGNPCISRGGNDIIGCLDSRASNYNPNATTACTSCCVMSTISSSSSGMSRFSGFDGGDPGFGRWQRQLSAKIAIDDTDWNPLIS